ncbi:adenine/guanine phosphoribosyltransferase-like PRPP-binding protein [Kitasatospora sp. GAS204A]|uniref:phosphoribosyltransferase n=1 Tax=unclassified Kitasatospora TaxID=2633591 RepID=UPI0024754856|nr:phosphoribosyltransferase [Kitasatospora sp. GAS204B]MDH6118619.1 adenine/guanine phosphoribosyltransferase-like PRPP-binding protein [Kitasatospora sp. GAS204B]
MTTEAVWSGRWVADRLGIGLHGDAELPELLGLAVREGNPRRAQLLVSQVLGKHVPQRPAVVYGAGRRLGAAVRSRLDLRPGEPVTVLGFAETATGLGHCVADELEASYLHSTRRPVAGLEPAAGFEEEHSHATSHLLLPADPELLSAAGPLILVDDELSTGQTALNIIAALHRHRPRRRYGLAALVDLRGVADRKRLATFAAELGVTIEVVALAEGRVRLPAGTGERARRLAAELGAGGAAVAGVRARASAGGAAGAGDSDGGDAAEVVRVPLPWPVGVPEGGRHGFVCAQRVRLEAALPELGELLAKELAGGERRVLVLGCEELIYAPLRLAEALQVALRGTLRATPWSADVWFSTTTRSPVLAVDDPGYPIRTRLRFPAHGAPGEGGEPRFAYNVAPGREAGRRFDAIVLVVDAAADTPELHAPEGLLAQLREVTDQVVLTVLPEYRPVTARPLRGPEFSSYPAAEVGWLLTDLSGVALEASTEEREEAVQSGGAHYAESLPVEYQPSPEYQELFHLALRGSARRIALAVGTVAETLLHERGEHLVLASLARAGTPVGILIRRWLAAEHRIEAPHYAVSIIRGRGIDPVALRYLMDRHHPSDVVFVDGWTGKGAIARELAAALAGTPFDPELAVLADPGRCVRTFGTREDFLIPSACLNSTVSGLVSRTVLRDDLIGPEDFHGAKYYRELGRADVSVAFLDIVAAHFPSVRAELAEAGGAVLGVASSAVEREPTWAGWTAVERISAQYGIGDVNLVKPGVGETTRVLLRRVPWRVLARRGVGSDLDHIRLLAAQRGVPVEEVDELPYSCVGLIHPRFSRGATGATGRVK